MRLHSSKVSLLPLSLSHSRSLVLKPRPQPSLPLPPLREGRCEMAGLSILLEAQKTFNKSPKIISKITMIKPASSPPPSPRPSSSLHPSRPLPAISFLDRCCLCDKPLSPGKDIYMYRGDKAFCSVECRCRQIFMDEESVVKENCSASAAASRRRSKAPAKNRAGGLFAY